MIRSNKMINQGIQFRVISEDQCQDIHNAVLEVLENVGMSVESKKAIDVFQKAGAFVEGSLVKIPSQLVEKALRSAPSRIVLADRKGNRKIELGGYNAYYGPGPTNVFINDPYNGERRSPKSADTIKAMRVIDALPNIDFVMDFGTITDAPSETNDLHLLKLMMNHTTKPICHWAKTLKNQKAQTEMVSSVAGGLAEFQKNPFVFWFTTTSSPLTQTDQALERLMYCAENLLPNCHTTAPMSGGTAPVTSAGTIVLSLVETIFGLVLSQLVREGSPCFIGCVDGPLDMKTMCMSYGNPEFQLMNAVFTEMGHYYNIPTWGAAGCTDSKIVDQQAAIEATASIMMQAFVGANIIHDVGFMEGGMLNGLEQLVMSDEIIGYTRKILGGLEISPTTLATDVIKDAGPGGNYFGQQHTFDHFKNSWSSTLLDKGRYDTWVSNGRQSMGDRIGAKMRNLIETHRAETLSDDINETLDGIISAVDNIRN